METYLLKNICKIENILDLNFKISYGICVDYLNSNESLHILKKCIKEILSFKESIKDLTQELDCVSIINSICDLKTSVKLIKLEQELHQQKLTSISTQSSFDSKSQIVFQTNPKNSAKKEEDSSLQWKRDSFMDSF